MASNSTVFTASPQAKDDLFANTGLTEDSLSGIKYLDVMANDLGSGTNTLYSLADGKSDGDSRLKALATQDAVGTVNQTTLGAKIWITADGKVAYDASALSTAQFQRLGAGQSATDSFTYAIKLSNGALSWATAKVQIVGSNDAPVINLSSLTIDGDSSSGKVKGTLLYTDADRGDKHTSSVSLQPLVASAGTPDLSTSLAQSLRTTIDDEGENGKGALKWDFSLPSGFPKLTAGQAVLADYQMSIADNHGGISAPQDVNLLILGTGSTPKVYTVAAHADLAEQLGKTGSTALDQASGVISGKNLGLEDKGNLSSVLVMSSWSTGSAIPAATATALASSLSTSTVPTSKGGESDKNIAWQFSTPDKTFDFLAAGETMTLAYRVSSAKEQDGKSQIITITITGTNDAPVITSSAAAATGATQEDITLGATGQLSASDSDHGATQAWSVQGNATGSYGTLAVDATGKWTYILTNTGAAVQALAVGETQNDTFTVRVTDDKGATADQTVTVTVTGTNDAPVITSTAAAAAGAVQEDMALSATGQLSASDVDHGATQAWSVQGNAAGAYGSLTVQGTTGKWTYTLNNSAAAVQALAAGESHDEMFTVRVTDDQGATADQTVTITVTGTNDAPMITSSTAAAAGAVQEDANTTATGQLSASDVDNGATQAWSVPGGGTGTYGTLAMNASSGQWTYVLSNSSAPVQALAAGEMQNDSFTMRVTDDKGATADQTVTVTITGTNDAPVINATQLTGAVTEQVTPNGNLTSSGTMAFSDPDLKDMHIVSTAATGISLGTLTASVAADTTGTGTGGQIAWNYSVPDSSVEYLAVGESRTESFTVTLDDQNGGMVNKPVTVTITGTNDAPVMALADTSGTVTALPAASTGGGTPTPIEFTVQQYLGVQSNDLTTLRNYAATHQANYTVQTNVIDYTDDPAGFAGELPGSSRWPAAEAQNVNGTGGINNSFFARITANFSVPTTDTYTFRTYNDDGVFLMIDNQTIISDSGIHPELPFNGSITLSPGNHTLELFFFEFGGEASLELSARNSTGSFGLLGASGGGLGGAVQVTDSGVIGFSDVDLTDAHLVSAAPVGTTVGTLTAVKASDTTGTGTGGQVDWTYTADNTKLETLAQGETKYDHFDITVNDQHGGTTTKQVEVSVVGVNDAPAAVADNGSQKNNEVKSYNVLGNDTDVDQGAVLSIATASVAAGSGAVQVVGGQIQFDPVQDFRALRLNETKVVNVNYTVTDEHGAQANSTLAVTVIGTNSPPTAVADSLTTNEDTPLQFSAASLLGNDTDPDTGDTKGIVSVTSPTHGTLVDGGNGSYTYTPAADYNGPDAFSYTMKDAAGEPSSAQVNLNVKPVNDAPVAVNDANSLTATTLASQAHSNVVNWVDWTSATGGGNGTPGTIYGTINLGNGQTVGVTYSGEYFFAQTNGGTDYYNLQNGTVPVGTYTSAAVANGPNGSSDIIALNQQTQKTLTFTQPVDNLFFAVVSLNGMGGGVNNGYLFDHDFQIASAGPGYFGTGAATKIALPDGRFELLSTYNNNGALREFHGVVQIDGTVQSLTWTSLAAETWNGFTIGTYGKSLTATATGTVLVNDSDPESDPMTVSAVNGAAIVGNSITLNLASGAEITVDKNGTYLYDENGAFGSLGQGQSKQDSFTYTVSDGHGGTSNAATVAITVNGVNDAPVASNDTATTNEDTPISIAVLANDTDVDTGDSTSLQSATGAQHGSLSISGNNVVYTPAANYNGADSFTYTMRDAAGAQSTATVNVAVNPVSDSYTLSNLITNGSFEQFAGGNTSAGSTAITGWTVTGSDVDRVVSTGWQSGDGAYSLDLNGFHTGGVSQVLQTTPGVQYTVGFDLSKNPGDTTYATVQVSAAGNSQSYTFNAANSATNMLWSQQAFTFTATGTATTLNFASTYPNDSTGSFPINAQGPALDEVVVFTNKTVGNFSKGAGGDVLQLHDLLTSVSAPHDSTAFSGGYLRFLQSGSDTLVQIDTNGGGDAYLTVATLIGQSLTQADTPNYLL